MKNFIRAGAAGVAIVGIIAFNLAVLAGVIFVVVWVLRALNVLPPA